jgi:hypothetical protein
MVATLCMVSIGKLTNRGRPQSIELGSDKYEGYAQIELGSLQSKLHSDEF